MSETNKKRIRRRVEYVCKCMFTFGWTTVIIGGTYLFKEQSAGLAVAVTLALILAAISTFDAFSEQPSGLITKLIWRRIYGKS